jgi:hypothetical protein
MKKIANHIPKLPPKLLHLRRFIYLQKMSRAKNKINEKLNKCKK